MTIKTRDRALLAAGATLLIYLMVVSLIDLSHINNAQEKLLGLIASFLAGIMGWALPGSSVLHVEVKYPSIRVGLNASGSISCVFVVLYWWTTTTSPVGRPTKVTIFQWIREARQVLTDSNFARDKFLQPARDEPSENSRSSPSEPEKIENQRQSKGMVLTQYVIGETSEQITKTDLLKSESRVANSIQFANQIVNTPRSPEPPRSPETTNNGLKPEPTGSGDPNDTNSPPVIIPEQNAPAGAASDNHQLLLLRKADFNSETFLPTGTFQTISIDSDALARKIISITSVNQYLPYAAMMTRFQNDFPVETIDLQLNRLTGDQVFAFRSRGSLFLEGGDPIQTFKLLTENWPNCYWLESSISPIEATAWIPGGGYFINLRLIGNRISFDVTNSIVDVSPLRARQKPNQPPWPR